MKLGRDEVLMVPSVIFRSDPPRGGSRVGQKLLDGKNRSRGPLLQETTSSDWKATATNQMDSNDLEACWKKCSYFWFRSEVKFLTLFDVFLDLVIVANFNANFYILLCSKELYLHLFCVISMFLRGRMLISKI